MNKSSVIALFLLMAGVMNAQDNNNTRIKFVEGFWDHQVNGIFYKEVTREDGMKAVEVALPQVWYLNPDGSYVNIWSSEYPYMQTEITIPESITVGDGVTGGAVTYPVVGLGDYAFRGASKLTHLTLPNTISYVGAEAFEGTDTLRTFTIPHSVRSVGSLAFARSGIEEIHVPYNANEWLDSYSAFQSCEKLRKVTFSDTLVAIQNRMFWGCTALEEVYIPDGVKYIGEGAFSACQNLAEIHLPAMLDTLRNRTFHSCPLRKLEIPAGVQYVEPSALLGTYLMNLTVDPGNGRYDSRDNCNAIVRTRDNTIVAACNGSFIPESVDSIGWEAFVELDGIRSITFPKHLKHIASEGLFNLWNLTLVTSYIDKPAGVLEDGAISGWDENVLDNITLYVPAGTLAAYKADSEWAKFKHIIEMSGECK